MTYDTFQTPAESPTMVYIVGRGHSGSTMLELLLNRSRNVAAMGEIDMLALQIFRDEKTRWVGQCSCGSRPFDCEIWKDVLNDVAAVYKKDIVADPFAWRISDVGTEEEFGVRAPLSWVAYKFHRLVRTYAYAGLGHSVGPLESTYRNWIENRDFVATSYAKHRGVSAVVDASKDPLQMRDIVKYSNLKTKILFLTRDVRGLVWSAMRKKRLTAREEAVSWAKLNRRTYHLLKGVDRDLWMQVKYEDLCANTEDSLDQIFKFLELPRKTLTPQEELSRRHTIAGNRTRFRLLDQIKEDLGWKENLSSEDLLMVKNIAGDISDMLGY